MEENKTSHSHRGYPTAYKDSFIVWFLHTTRKRRISPPPPLQYPPFVISLALYVSFHPSNLALRGDANTRQYVPGLFIRQVMHSAFPSEISLDGCRNQMAQETQIIGHANKTARGDPPPQPPLHSL